MNTTQADLLRDGTRMRLMDAAERGGTAAELASAIGVPVTRIYHHIDKLVAADLLEVVDIQKQDASVVRRYRATSVDLNRVGGKDDVVRALRDAERDVADATADAVRFGGRTIARMTPDQAKELVAGVTALVDEIAGRTEPPEGDLVGFTYLVAPIARPRPAPHTLRPATDADQEIIQRIVYEAISWNPEEVIPPLDAIRDHPEFARYHDGWGRAGDQGVVAISDGEPIAGAFYRLFTDDDHGHGYLDEDTPEMAIAVWGAPKGKGLGSELIEALHTMASDAGFATISLSVDNDNPAVHLYQRHGYVIETVDDRSTRMIARV
jgi:GNAT superfamily N-acetyltransferase/DNA-binding transcriptional ArsR family regulator